MLRFSLVVSAVLVLCACGDDGGGKGNGEPDAGGEPRVLFELPAEAGQPAPIASLPFPNDALLADGQLEIPPETMPFNDNADGVVLAAFSRGFGELDCFGISGGVIFPTADLGDDAVDPASLASAAHIVDLESGAEIPAEVHVRSKGGLLHVRPRREYRLEEGRQYGVYLDADLATTGGTALAASPDLEALLADADPEARLAAAHAAYAPLRAHLAGAEVSGATVFSTCDYHTQMQAIADAVLANAPPAVVVDHIYRAGAELDGFLGTPADPAGPGFDNPGGIAHASIAAVVLGHYPSPYFLSEDPLARGRIEFDGAGAPIVKSTTDIPFLLVLPAGVDSYENVPVVVFQHGLGNSRRHVMAMANTLAARGFAVAGIDIPFHGDRHAGAIDSSHNFTSEQTPDGLADSSATALPTFFNLTDGDGVEHLDPLVMSDNFRQSAADLVLFSRVLTDGDLAAIGAEEPDFADLSLDDEHIVYSSESFGGFVGVTAVAYAPAFGAAWFSVAGGGLADHVLGNSPNYGTFFIPVIAGTFGLSPNDLNPMYDPPHTHYAFQMLSMLLDRGDPLTYAPRLLPGGTHVVLSAAFSDEAVPNQSNEALALRIGLEWAPTEGTVEAPRYVEDYGTAAIPATGNVEVGGKALTAAFFELDPASHSMLTSKNDDRNYEVGFPPMIEIDPPLPIENPIARLQGLLATYAETYVATGTPTLE